MSEELGVRSEELIGLMRGCASGSSEFCQSCKLRGYFQCYDVLMAAAADEIERLTASPVAAATPSRSGRERELTANEYQRLSMRTAETLKRRSERLLNGLMGLCGESGECIDLLKKYFYQGHDLDEAKLADELGDVAWYLALAADAMGMTLGEIMQRNIEKLRKRYPEGFDAERSRNREEEA